MNPCIIKISVTHLRSGSRSRRSHRCWLRSWLPPIRRGNRMCRSSHRPHTYLQTKYLGEWYFQYLGTTKIVCNSFCNTLLEFGFIRKKERSSKMSVNSFDGYASWWSLKNRKMMKIRWRNCKNGAVCTAVLARCISAVVDVGLAFVTSVSDDASACVLGNAVNTFA